MRCTHALTRHLATSHGPLCLRCGHYLDPQADRRAERILAERLPWKAQEILPDAMFEDRPTEAELLADLESFEIALRARFLVLTGRPWRGTFEWTCRYWNCHYEPETAAAEEMTNGRG
jgi:hypothetical protein